MEEDYIVGSYRAQDGEEQMYLSLDDIRWLATKEILEDIDRCLR